MKKDFLPFALPLIGEDEIEEVVDSLRSGWVTTGPKVALFEKMFAESVGAKHALAVNSATAGLHLALEAIGIAPGDKVITSTYTFTATAEVMRYLGADPVFVDIEPDTLNLDLDQVEQLLAGDAALAQQVKAIMPVHFAGIACDMDRVMSIAQKFNLKVIEDAAHAFPSTYRGHMIGSIGDATVFSFYATKTICTGEGGMVTTENDELAARIKVMRLHGINRDVWDRYSSSKPSWYYEVIAPGYKYNMTDIAAAMGIHQLNKGETMRSTREGIAHRYDQVFSDLPIKLPSKGWRNQLHAWHLYVIRLDTEQLMIGRDQFIEQMATQGIGTSVHFIPLHQQPYWRDRYALSKSSFPVASAAFASAVSLPIYPGMDDADVERVITAVRKIILSSMKAKP